MKEDRYNKKSRLYTQIEIAIEKGAIEFGHNEWVLKDDIRANCKIFQLTPRGFEPILKQSPPIKKNIFIRFINWF